MRYLTLLLLNLPVIGLAIVNLVTRLKLERINRRRFARQILLWTIILIVVAGSFPVYNVITGREPFSSDDLSVFDIVQTTIIILLIYVLNNQRQKFDILDRTVRDLHQELSIKLSEKR